MRLLSHIGEGMTLRAHVRAWIAAILDGSRDCRSLQQQLLLLRALLSLPFERARVARPRARACGGEGGSRRSGRRHESPRPLTGRGTAARCCCCCCCCSARCCRCPSSARVARARARACRGEGGRPLAPAAPAGCWSGFASPAALAGCRSAPRRRPLAPAALAGCRSGFARRRPPLRDAGRLRAVDPLARVDAARPWPPAAAIARRRAPRAHHAVMRKPVTALVLSGCLQMLRHRRRCYGRLSSTDEGPSGLRARRGMASPGAVAFALRAARPRRRARTRVGTARPCLPAAPRPREPALRSE